MDTKILLIVLCPICIYLGHVLGLMAYCDNCNELKHAKKYTWFVPIVKIVLSTMYFLSCIKKGQWSKLWWYFRFGGKSILILCTIVEIESMPATSPECSVKSNVITWEHHHHLRYPGLNPIRIFLEHTQSVLVRSIQFQ